MPSVSAAPGDVLDALHQLDQPLVPVGRGRGEADAAVAHHDRGDAVPRRRREPRVPRDLGVVVGVDVDPARGDQQPVGVDVGEADRRSAQLSGWLHAVPPDSLSARYLERLLIPFTAVLARLVPTFEISSGVAMVAGLWTPLFAFLAFSMALSFHIASGAIFNNSFLASAGGLPVLGATLALMLGGIRLPWSIRKS